MKRYYKREDAEKMLEEKRNEAQNVRDLLAKALPVLTTYATKQKLLNKRIVPMMLEVGVYAGINDSYGQPRLYITDKETRKATDIWPDVKLINEHGKLSEFFVNTCASRLDHAGAYLDMVLRDIVNLDKVWEVVEEIRAMQDAITEKVGMPPDYNPEGEYELSYSMRDIIKDGTELR